MKLMLLVILLVVLHSTYGYKFIGISKAFDDKPCAFILRVDDITCKDVYNGTSNWNNPLILLRLSLNYGIKVTYGIITGEYRNPPNVLECNAEWIQTFKQMNDFGEVASHSRWHLDVQERYNKGWPTLYGDIVGMVT